MKKLILIAITAIAGMMVQSCSTTEKFTVKTNGYEKVSLPGNISGATVDYAGDKADVVVPSKAYLGYMLQTDKNTGLEVPFGIDFKKKSRAGEKISEGIGVVFDGIGLVSMTTGLIMLLASGDDEDLQNTAAIAVGIGGGSVLIGTGFGLTGSSRLGQISHKYQFEYLPVQNTYNGELSATLLTPSPVKTTEEPKARRKAAVQASEEPAGAPASGTAAKKSRRDIAKKVAGEYKVEGRLLKDGKVDEEYSDASILIEADGKSAVFVTVYESGEEFFDGKMAYDVKENADGSHTLTMRSNPKATITITADGKIKYHHPQVIIDDETYVLDFE